MNLLKRVAVPLVLGKQCPRLNNTPRHRVPWINIEIIIAERHAQKGYKGIIIDVLCNQQTPSGLKLLIQLTALDPNSPFRRFILDYDDVVEARYVVFACAESLMLMFG
jgi:hypothetical protein